MSFKNVDYTKLEIDSDEDSRNRPISQPLNANFEKDGFIESDATNEDTIKSPGLLSFDFYQKLFDVDTKDVLGRLLYSFVPRLHKSYIKDVIGNKPDLYGPFWTCTTLILTLAITGNIASYFQSSGKVNYWNYDFKKLSLAALTIYTYWWIMPLLIWGVTKLKKISGSSSFLELLTLYGYSLAIYIPISVFWVVQFTWLQWLLVLVALCLSGVVLVMAIWSSYSAANKQVCLILSAFVAVMHAALSVGFMLYFFHVPASVSQSEHKINMSKSV